MAGQSPDDAVPLPRWTGTSAAPSRQPKSMHA